MREAFSLFELIIALFVLSCALILGGRLSSQPPLATITQSLLSDIALTQNLALNDSHFFPNLHSTDFITSLSPTIDPQKLITNNAKSMWQIQFHLNGRYTQNSYSIYIDTPRHSLSTDYDGRPMSGDFIAIESSSNQCLSGYNNTNISDYCKNNSSTTVRLKEQFGIDHILLEGDLFCAEKGGARIYFDDFGVPYCGNTPQKITKPFKITLWKEKESQSICILPTTGYASLCE